MFVTAMLQRVKYSYKTNVFLNVTHKYKLVSVTMKRLL
jgi:hypothetical protein